MTATGPQPFPPSFRTREVRNGETTIHVRLGGTGPAVLMLHGFAETGDMWAPLAAALFNDHTIVVPDLRGMGLSSHPEGGYDKKTQAGDVACVLDAIGVGKADLVTHDIGAQSRAGDPSRRHGLLRTGRRTMG